MNIFPEIVFPSRPVHPAIKRTLRFLDRHWHRPIDVGDLATASRLSRRGLAKAFIRQIGYGPGRFLLCLRIRRAQQLLVRTDWSLQAIADVCGFKSANSFWVAFRRESEMTPGQYRRHFGRPRPLDRSVKSERSAGAQLQKLHANLPKSRGRDLFPPLKIINRREQAL